MSDRAKKFASKRTKIAHYYYDHSNLKIELVSAADRYYTYGFVAFVVEPDFDHRCPQILVDDPMGAYYTRNLRGEVQHYVKVWKEDALGLAAKFPAHRDVILGDGDPFGTGGDRHELEVIRYIDRDT